MGLLTVMFVALAAPIAGADHGSARLHPTVHTEATDVAAGPLDLASASFGQEQTRLELSVVTRGAWEAGQLAPDGPRALCLTLSYGKPRRPRSQLCVDGRESRPVLLRVALDRSGNRFGPATLVHADVEREDDHRLRASFTPLSAGLPHGRYGWRLEARWAVGSACQAPGACADQIPRRGFVASRAGLLGGPRCFGAADRDHEQPCHNAALARVVVPTPENAPITTNAPCTPLATVGELLPCEFGVPAEQARSTLALVGDSHASHWRGALEVVSQALRWRGLSVTRTSCPFSHAHAQITKSERSAPCVQWNREVRLWLASHPEVGTVVLSSHAAARFASDPEAGYRGAWRALPPSVRHIFVIRDTPGNGYAQADCVTALLHAHRRIGLGCAEPRAKMLRGDPAANATRVKGADPRVRLIDLTSYMCGVRLCRAVVGGVLVRKDDEHLTNIFSTTLGPYVLRAMRHAGVAR